MKTLAGMQVLVFAVFLLAYSRGNATQADEAPELASFVNPFVGTDAGGDTFPGVAVPFGLVQMTPNWKGNGYYYNDTAMHGFVVNSLSGDGGANEGEVLMTATTGPVKIDRASTDFKFDHQHESASDGYYQVLMQPWGINAELTATPHCGCVRFTFPAGQQANILLPLSYTNTKTLSSHVTVIDDRTISGDVTCASFNGRRDGITAYFVMKFSKPFTSHGTWTHDTMTNNSATAAQDKKGAVIGFYGSYPSSPSPQEVDVRIGVSYVDDQGARANLEAEMPDDNFDRYHAQARALWNKELGLIEVQGGTLAHNRVFYTALYHCLLSPIVFDDVDGRYRGFDEKIHHVPEGHQHFYADFSGWDIYRTEMPLLSIIEPKRVEDMAQSLVEEYKQIGYIDRWSELNRATAIMNGDPLTIFLVHAWNAGLHNFDIATAYEAMLKEARPGNPHPHIGTYELYAEERDGVTLNPDASPSSALEHELAFAAAGNLAESLKKPEADFLHQRAMQYRSLYNPASGFLERHNPDGSWDETARDFTEGNKWIYRWFVPHDVQGLVNLMGGAPIFEARLDAFFKGMPHFSGSQYDPTNEPDLQAPFLYDYINRPWKTQHIVAEIADKMFTDEPGGLAGGGNDDLGTMSAWYILTQLGFYPVDPGFPSFETCTPRFEKIVIHLSEPHAGKQFVIQAAGAAPENEYIQSSILNGKPLTNAWFPEDEITRGGTWEVTTSATPNKDQDLSPYHPPHSLSTGYAQQPPNPGARPLITILPTSEDQPQSWSYTTTQPAADWMSPTFDDSAWQKGPAGFGTDDENVKPRTPWTTDDIWMRRTFDLPAHHAKLAVTAYHDQGVQIYINGALVGESPDWTHVYEEFPLTSEADAKLQPTGNVIALHVHHPGGGRHFSDAGIIEYQ
jgi:predicted alpha-1,2-mannosidase